MSFFGVDIPKSPEIIVKIRLITGRGRPIVAWEGSTDANEAEVLEELCKSALVCTFVKQAAANHRIRLDENGAFKVQAKIICYECGQVIQETLTEIPIFPLLGVEEREGESGDVGLEVIRTLVDSLTSRQEHLQQMMEQVNRMQQNYEIAVGKISQHSLQAMDKISGHASSAFSAAAAPFAEMGKSLVKALDESRNNSSTQAKESHEQLVRALTNRIIEGNKIQQRQGIMQDVKEVLELLPMVKTLLGEPAAKS